MGRKPPVGWFALVVLIYCLILPAGCTRRPEVITEEPVGPYSEENFRNFEFIDSHPACQTSSECVLMQVGGCMKVRALHRSEIELAEAYTQYAQKRDIDVQCAPDLPVEEYEALCLNSLCTQFPRSYRMLLEVPEQPVAGEPFWIGLSFRFPISSELVTAGFLLPETVLVINGNTEWSGHTEALEDHVLWIQIQSNRAGDLNLGAWAKAESDPSMPSLNTAQVVDVAMPVKKTPPVTRERIISTPTRSN